MKHRRRKFLINPKFQLRFSFYICSWIVALSVVYPLVIYNLFDFFVRYAALDPYGPSVERLFQTRREMLSLLVVLQLVFIGGTFLISVFLSHRIAGPIYKLMTFFKEAEAGRMDQKLHFRNYDHFPELAEGYNSMTAAVRRTMRPGGKAAMQAVAKIEKALDSQDGFSAESRKELGEALSVLKSTAAVSE